MRIRWIDQVGAVAGAPSAGDMAATADAASTDTKLRIPLAMPTPPPDPIDELGRLS